MLVKWTQNAYLLTLINLESNMNQGAYAYSVRDEITYPLPNWNGCTVEIWWVIPSHTLLVQALLMQANPLPWYHEWQEHISCFVLNCSNSIANALVTAVLHKVVDIISWDNDKHIHCACRCVDTGNRGVNVGLWLHYRQIHHYSDVIKSAMAFYITSLTIVN